MTEISGDAERISAIYNTFGDYYHESRKDDAGRFSNEFIDVPALLSLLDDELVGKRVLDAGCGSGIIPRLLAAKGATVDGVDASTRMIEIATSEKPLDLHINYTVGDIAQLTFADSTFDLVICNYVLENIADISRVFREFHRILRGDGRCIFSISHPLRACAERTSHEGDEVWVIRDYFDRGIRQSDFGGGMVVPKYKRPLSDYVNAIANGGFLIKQLLEPQPIADAERSHPESYAKAMRLPQLLTIELVTR